MILVYTGWYFNWTEVLHESIIISYDMCETLVSFRHSKWGSNLGSDYETITNHLRTTDLTVFLINTTFPLVKNSY